LGENFSDLIPGIRFLRNASGPYTSIAVNTYPYFIHITLGPIKMGATYIFRNFAREEHARLSDIFSRAMSNRIFGIAKR